MRCRNDGRNIANTFISTLLKPEIIIKKNPSTICRNNVMSE